MGPCTHGGLGKDVVRKKKNPIKIWQFDTVMRNDKCPENINHVLQSLRAASEHFILWLLLTEPVLFC